MNMIVPRVCGPQLPMSMMAMPSNFRVDDFALMNVQQNYVVL
jgi:hypothetical protein